MVLLLADSSSVYHLFHLSPLLLVFSCGRNRGKANGKIQLDKATKEFDALATAATKAEAKATELKAKVWGGRGRSSVVGLGHPRNTTFVAISSNPSSLP